MSNADSLSNVIEYSTQRRIIEGLLQGIGICVNGSADHDLTVLDERFFTAVLAQGRLALGETYMDGWWTSPKPDQFITKLLEAKIEDQVTPWSLKLQILAAKFLNQQDRIKCRRVVVDHYDLSNHLYSKMLDPYMQYTCAYYANAETLEQAQIDKLEQICKKLQLKSSDKVLELGCGFGGLAKYIAENYGCQVVGYNISKEQVAWAKNWTKDLPVDIRLQDYRDAVGSYDKVVSVGLCEHVGYKNYRTLMKIAHRCLKDRGLFLLHCIGGNESKFTTDPWLEKYIFPGSVMPSAEQLSQAFQGLFVMEDWHNFGVDYDLTLMHWHENFVKNWQELSSEYDQRFYKMWEYYLLMCAGSFRARKNQNWELVLSKGGVVGGYRAFAK
jgi:cyclopropane-fatty-acyl-phospholipid synthase